MVQVGGMSGLITKRKIPPLRSGYPANGEYNILPTRQTGSPTIRGHPESL